MNEISYSAPRSLADALRALTDLPGRVRPLAGGTDLIAQLREGRREADSILDLKRIPELNELSLDPARGLVMGAAVPFTRVNEDAALARAFPCIIDAASLVGSIQIQNRASFGGNLCNASPAADGIPPLIVHRARCRIAGARGEREVPVEDFCTGPGRTVLERGELLVSLLVPSPRPRSGARYLRFIPRNEMDIAVAGAAACLELEDDGETIREARVALAAVGPTPILAAEAGEALRGRRAGAAAFDAAAEAARKAAKPISDLRGTERHRRHVVGVLVRRALEEALKRARENGRKREA